MNAPAPGEVETSPGRPEALTWAGVVLAFTPLLIRASVTLDLFPGWDIDPFTNPVVRTGVSPAWSIACDAVSLAGSALLLASGWVRGDRVLVRPLLLGGIGCIGVLAHALIIGGGALGDARIGLAWVSAIALALGLLHAAREPRVRSAATATLLGFIALLAVRGMHEFFIDHPRTIADFDANRAQVLASHGWTEGSSMARAFERRLRQSDVSGWFGLSNVYAAMCAAGATIAFGMLIAPYRARSSSRHGLFGLGAATMLALAGVALAQSKGGAITLLVGLGALALLGFFARLRQRGRDRSARVLGGLLGVGAIAGALAVIAARALAGERIGELSLFFRWFYIQSASRIFGAHPLFGVGPDGFQAAYTRAKVPISPEEVSSPHSIAFDWLATLGVFGLAWVALLLWMAWNAGVAGVVREEAPSSDDTARNRNATRTVMLIASLATLGASAAQGSVVTPDLALVRAIGLAVWCGVAWAVLRAARGGNSRISAALSGGAIALLAHGQIDVEFSWVQSCGPALALVALAAAGSRTVIPRTTRAPRSRGALICAAAVGLVALLAGVLLIPRAVRWESALRNAVEAVSPVAEIAERMQDLARSRAEGRASVDTPDRIAGDLARELGRPVASRPDDVHRAILELEARASADAAEHLMRADAIDPADARARREASRVLVRRADALQALGRTDDSATALGRAIAILARENRRPTPGLLANLAQVYVRRAEMLNHSDDLDLADRALEGAMRLDPYNLDLARQRYRLAVKAKRPADARRWAERCLALDRLMRLDKDVRGLSDSERIDLERAAGIAPHEGRAPTSPPPTNP